MKRVAILLAVVALLGASVASAGTITYSNTGPVSIGVTVDTTMDSTYDVITLKIAGFTSSSTDKVTMLAGGKWVCAGGGFYLPGENVSEEALDPWTNYTSTGYSATFTGTNSTSTAFNFVSSNATLFDGATPAFRTPLSGDNYSAFGDYWLTTTTTKYLGLNKTLGVLWVTKGWQTIDFVDYNVDNAAYISTVQLGGAGAQLETIHISSGDAPITPEPSTIAILAMGLVGLAAYAWRKRK